MDITSYYITVITGPLFYTLASDKTFRNLNSGSSVVEERETDRMDSFELMTYFMAALGVIVLCLCVVVASILIYHFCRSVSVSVSVSGQ